MNEKSSDKLTNPVSAKAIKVLLEIRRHPERYHPITNRQYSDFRYFPTANNKAKKISRKQGAKNLVKVAIEYRERLQIRNLVGWNAGTISDKPWYMISWIDKSGDQLLGCVISDKCIEDSKYEDIDAIFENNNIYHKSKNFTPFFADGPKQNVLFGKSDEGKNGSFFYLILKIKTHDQSEPCCLVELAPIDDLVNFNKKYQKQPRKLYKNQKIRISNRCLENATESLLDVRTFPSKYYPITDTQWLDLDTDINIINQRFSQFSPTLSPITIGGYTLDQLREGMRNADQAKDMKSFNLIKSMCLMWFRNFQLDKIFPQTVAKKILGWNAGCLEIAPSLPWFSICYQDSNDRIMMCLWISDRCTRYMSLAKIDQAMQNDYVYEKQNNFVDILPHQDQNGFTFSIKRITENSGKSFSIIHVLLQEKPDSPLVCRATFCPIESLHRINDTTHIISKKTLNRVVADIELNNNTLKEIDADRIGLIFYNESNSEFSVIVKPQNQEKPRLVKRSKNIFIGQVDFIRYRGTYSTQHLIPDNLLKHYALLLDNDDVRRQFGNEDEIFALDKLSGLIFTEGWRIFNSQAQHLMIAPWFSDEYLSNMEDTIRLKLSGRVYSSNYGSDFITCWKEILNDYVGYDIKPTLIESPLKIFFENIIAYGSSEDGHVEIAIKDVDDKNKIKIFSSKIKNAKTFKNFLDMGYDKECRVGNLFEGWRGYRDGANRFLNVRYEYFDDIFTARRARKKIVDLKIVQINDSDQTEICDIVIQCKDDFFTND